MFGPSGRLLKMIVRKLCRGYSAWKFRVKSLLCYNFHLGVSSQTPTPEV